MEAADDERGAPCDFCGAEVELDGWFGLEVQRPSTVSRHVRRAWSVPATWDVVFCSQEHAAAWLSQPLPTDRGRVEPVGRERPRWDALVDLAVISCLGGAVTLAVIGLWTVIGWIWGG